MSDLTFWSLFIGAIFVVVCPFIICVWWPEIKEKVVSMVPQPAKQPERTPISHAGNAVLRVLTVFGVIGGLTGAGIGNVEGWRHLYWMYALYISIATLSTFVGLYWYANDH